jgi:hypothetical protein
MQQVAQAGMGGRPAGRHARMGPCVTDGLLAAALLQISNNS